MSHGTGIHGRRSPGRALAVLLVLGLALGGLTAPLGATTLDWGKDDQDKPLGPLSFPSGSTIKVYVEVDATRSGPVKEGLQRWVAEMATRGITVEINDMPVPSPRPANTVEVTFEPDGTKSGELELGTGGDKVDGVGIASSDGTNLIGGKIIIREALPAGTDGEKNFLRNLAQHEFCHVLGLADDDDGQVTDHHQGTDATNDLNGTDKKELKQLYPKTGGGKSTASSTTVPSGDPNTYDFDFNYEPDAPGDEAGHVTLLLLHVEPSLIVDVLVPPGWEVLNPADPGRLDLQNYPFYQGYAEDWNSDQPPWDPAFTAPLSLRSLAESFALSESNPQLHVTLLTHGAVRGTIDAWAGGDVQQMEGPVPPPAPAPALGRWGVIVLVLVVVVAGALGWRRLSQPDAPTG